MASKKKTNKKKQTKPTTTVGKRGTPRKSSIQKDRVKSRTSPKKKSAKSKVGSKKVVLKANDRAVKAVLSKKSTGALAKQSRPKRQRAQTVDFASPPRLGARSGEQAGDLQALSNVQRADSESVDELLEEGNAFEAGVVSGIEAADDADEREVRTHEVPEDDVPEEYLDEK
jgi:hypothetical protein